MSYMRSMQQNKANAAKAKAIFTSEHVGPLDVLIVSGESNEPWFLYFKKDQLGKDGAFAAMKKFIKEYRRAGADSRWAFTFDRKDRWHSVRPPPPPRCSHATATAPPVPALTRLTPRPATPCLAD